MDTVSTSWPSYVAIAKDIFTIVAIVIGGFWTYMYFIKDRVFQHRLNPSVEGCWMKTGQTNKLVVKMSVVNRGRVRAILEDEGSGLLVYGYKKRPAGDDADEIEPDYLGAFPIFGPRFWEGAKSGSHAAKTLWVESNESMIDTKVIDFIGENYSAIQVEITIHSGKHFWISSACLLEPETSPSEISRG